MSVTILPPPLPAELLAKFITWADERAAALTEAVAAHEVARQATADCAAEANGAARLRRALNDHVAATFRQESVEPALYQYYRAYDEQLGSLVGKLTTAKQHEAAALIKVQRCQSALRQAEMLIPRPAPAPVVEDDVEVLAEAAD